jgi:hypothetical protein
MRTSETVIDRLAADLRPVKPLRRPGLRALITLAAIALAAGMAIALVGDMSALRERYAGREALLMLEMAAMAGTGALAVAAAFIVSIPGASKRWLAAPLPFFGAWLLLSGLGCYADPARRDPIPGETGESVHCLVFILATSALLTPILIWLLAKARPIDPLPVALLGGLGAAATSAFVLQFFHPFAVTFMDLAVHLLAMLIVVGAAGLINRRALAPA